MFGGGRTQVGKTYLKVAMAVLAHLMNCTTVVVTNVGRNVQDLASTIGVAMRSLPLGRHTCA
jgi:hypothetical protein